MLKCYFSEDSTKKQAFSKGRPKGSRKLNLSDPDTAVKVGITLPILQGQNSEKHKTEGVFDRQVIFFVFFKNNLENSYWYAIQIHI